MKSVAERDGLNKIVFSKGWAISALLEHTGAQTDIVVVCYRHLIIKSCLSANDPIADACELGFLVLMSGAVQPRLSGRWTQASVGVAITIAPLLFLAGLQFLFAPQIVRTAWEVDPEIERWAISAFRHSLLESYAYPISLLAIYWLVSATACKGAFVRIRSANVVLAFGLMCFALAVLIASVAPPPFKAACSLLGIPQTDWPPGFDTQSSCERFSWRAAVTLAILMPALMFATSAALRIFLSHRRSRFNGS